MTVGGGLCLLVVATALCACDSQSPPGRPRAADSSPAKGSPLPEVVNPMPVLIERPGFRFAAAECAKASGKPLIPEFPALPSGAPGYEGVKPAVWRENGTLELEALLVQRCGIGFADAGYKVDKRVLSLEYKLDASQPAACNCLYRLSYQISGLPRAEYDVRFKGTGGDPNE